MPVIGNPYVLSPAQFRTIKKTAVEYIATKTVGRKLLPLDPEVGAGTQQVERTKYLKPENTSKIIAKGGEYDVFEPTEEKLRCNIYKIGKAFVVTDEDLESSRVTGNGLDKVAINMASQMIVESEEEFIFTGDSDMNEPGLVDLADETVDAEAGWDTDMLDPYEDMRQAISILSANGFTAKAAVFNNEDWGNILKRDSFGKSYFDILTESFPIPKENYFATSGMPSGKALVMDVGEQIADFKQVEPVNPRDPVRDTRDRQQINIRERIGKEVYLPEALVVIDGIIAE